MSTVAEVESKQVEALLGQYEDLREALIPILQEIQSTFYYLPQSILRRVATKLHIPLTDVYQVATFYRCFSLEPVGKHVVQVCLGTACHVRGGPRVLDRLFRDLKLGGEGTTKDHLFTVRSVRCLGCCGLAPVVQVGKRIHPHMTQAKVPGMLRQYRPKPAAEPEEVAEEVGRG
jgi:NADH:ubiquinone oxidoreductase subunit E